MGRIIAITGASAGIGKASVDRLISSNHKIIANARRGHLLAAMEAIYNNANETRLSTVVGDITNEQTIREIFLCSNRVFNAVPTGFLINAGHGLTGTPLTSDPSKWQALFDVNVMSAMKQMRIVAEEMLKDYETTGPQARDIVVLGSSIGRHVSPFNSVYGATKAAIHSLTEALRRELCSKMIRVSLIEPGIVETEFQAVAKYDPEWFKKYSDEIGPVLKAEDIARTIDFIVAQPAHIHVNDVLIRPTRQVYP